MLFSRLVVLFLVAPLCYVEARSSLRYAHAPALGSPSVLASTAALAKGVAAVDFNALLATANAERDTHELECISKAEAAGVGQQAKQVKIEHAERSLQAAAAAQVQMKVRAGSLYAKAGSVESRRHELRRLCGRLDDGRNSSKVLLNSARTLADSVMGVAAKMKGDFSAEVAQLQGSQNDQNAWLAQGSKVCSSKLSAVEAELTVARQGITDVENQLKVLEQSRASADSIRVANSQGLAKSQTDQAALKVTCDGYAAATEQKVQDLYARRAVVSGVSVTDCEVSAWHHGDCSKMCAGGTKNLTREVWRHASGGMACPSLATTVACNTQACEVACQIGAWTEWSQCSKMCNGGHRTRSRTVVAPRNSSSLLQLPGSVSSASAEVAMVDSDEAASCGLTHDVESCNTHACGSACTFGQWGSWGPCTKACGGGSRGRRREKSAANHTVAADTCQGWENEFSTCQAQQCPLASTFNCGARQDLVVMVDASELLTPSELDTQKAYVNELLGGKFTLNRDQGGIAGLVLFGSPVPMVLPLTDSIEALKTRLQPVSAGRGSLNLDKALDATRSLFAGWSARKDAPKTALVLLKGKPDSAVAAIEQAAKLKELGVRVVVAVVGSCLVNKHTLEQMASEPAADNVFYFKSYEELRSKKDEQAVHLCPSMAGGALPSQYLPKPAVA